MTKEERAENWFRNVPDAELVPMEARMKICADVSRKVVVVLSLLLTVECVVLFFINNGIVFTWLADLVNRFAAGSHTNKSLALVGSILVLPLMIVPATVAVLLKNRWVKAEALKFMKEKAS